MAQDIFLKIEGIEGESQDHKHKGEIDLLSYSWGASQAGTMQFGGGGGAGKVSMQDFQFTMLINKSSPKLMLACADGTHFKKATMTARKAGKDQQEFVKINFTDIIISSYQTSAHGGGGEIPMESISFNYTKVEWEYKEQKPDGTLGGTVRAGWDVKSNKAF